MAQTITTYFVGIDKSMSKTGRAAKRIIEDVSGTTRTLTTQVNTAKKGMDKWADSTKRVTTGFKSFRMELLGVMFFGMMIQRIFMGIAQTGTEAFMKITKGQTQAGQAIITLQAGFQFLKFTIGDAIGTALIPLMDTIVGIIEVVADWINQNPTLAAGLISAGIAAGMAFLAFGSLGLGLTSTAQAIGSGSGGFGILGALAAVPGWAKIAAIALVAAAALIYKNWDVLGPVFDKTVEALKKTFVDLETPIDELNKAWDDAFNAWVEGFTVVFIRIAKEVIKGLSFIFDMIQTAFRYHVQQILRPIVGSKEAGSIASSFFPSVAGAVSNPIIGMLDRYEADALSRIRGEGEGSTINIDQFNISIDGRVENELIAGEQAAYGFLRTLNDRGVKTTGGIL